MTHQTVRVVVVEDQPTLADHLRSLVDKQPGFTYIATAKSVKEALLLIPASAPQLVILDIELGDGTAFDILKALSPLNFQVVFATAFKEYAINAIKFGAMDYLLKPIDELEFRAALNKVSHAIPGSEQLELMQQHFLHPGTSGRIALRTGALVKIVSLEEIMYLESGDGTIFHLTEHRTITVHKTIKEFEELLPGQLFIRIHASTLVNIRYVDHYRPPGAVVLHNGTALDVAARRKDGLVSFLTGKHK